MASQAIGNFEVQPTQPFMLRDILPGPGWAPYTASERTHVSRIDRARVSDGEAVHGSVAKGVLIGLLMEAAAALIAYGAWQVWHLVR